MSQKRFKHHRIVELNGFKGLNSHDEILGFHAKDFMKSVHYNFKDKIINITKTKISRVRSKNSPCSFTRTILDRKKHNIFTFLQRIVKVPFRHIRMRLSGK